MSEVQTSSPGAPSATGSQVSGSMHSTSRWSDHTCMPCLTGHSHAMPGPRNSPMPYSLKASTPSAAVSRSRPDSGQGSAPKRPMRSLESRGEVDAALQRLVGEVEPVGRRRADGRHAEVDDQVDEQLLAADAGGHHADAGVLRAVLQADARRQAVAEAVLQQVAGAQADHPHGARVALRPRVHVAPRRPRWAWACRWCRRCCAPR